MKKTGIRQARQNLSALLDEVKKGREIIITERGKAVARLVAFRPRNARGLPDLSAFRRELPALVPPLSAAILENREEVHKNVV